jgi:hypothetical protein
MSLRLIALIAVEADDVRQDLQVNGSRHLKA